jgi:hypothetical protein
MTLARAGTEDKGMRCKLSHGNRRKCSGGYFSLDSKARQQSALASDARDSLYKRQRVGHAKYLRMEAIAGKCLVDLLPQSECSFGKNERKFAKF